MVTSLDSSKVDSFVLCIVRSASQKDHLGNISQAVNDLENWIKNHKVNFLARKLTADVAQGDLSLPKGDDPSFGVEVTRLREHIRASYSCDLCLCPSELSELLDRKGPALFVFDMDSTLIQMECIDEMARIAGVYDKVAVSPLPLCQVANHRQSLMKPWRESWTLRNP